MFGYNINLEEPTLCPYCNKKIKVEILDRVIDNTKDNISYILVCKCPSCYEIFFVKYEVGHISELSEIEKITGDKPMIPTKFIF